MTDGEEALVLEYLSGSLKPRSPDESKARAALTRMLRAIDAGSVTDPLSFNIRQALASLFTPENGWSELQLVLKFRNRGNRLNLLESIEVAGHVLEMEQAGMNRERAVESASKKFDLSRRTVFEKLKLLELSEQCSK
jgi:hypothetical protein